MRNVVCACVLLRVWLSREWLSLRARGRPLALFVARVGVERGTNLLKQAAPIVVGDEAFKLLNEQSDNRQQAPMQPFMAGPDPSQSYYANMRALGETPSGGNPFEQTWM